MLAAAAAAVLSGTPLQAADKAGDAAALKGVTTGKVVFDISTAKPETLATLLSVVRETYDDLVRQNVEPEMVLAIRGAPVKYVRADREDLPLETREAVEKVNAILDDLSKRPGVRVEVCAITNRMLGLADAGIKPNFHVVGNTWVSLVGYQAQGYALVPIN